MLIILNRIQFLYYSSYSILELYHTYYKTPYGEFTMGIYGNDVNWFRNGKNSVLKLKYTLDFNNGYVSENSMNIYIEEKQ